MADEPGTLAFHPRHRLYSRSDLTEDGDPFFFLDGTLYYFSVFKSANSMPNGSGKTNGICTLTPLNGRTNDSYTATYIGGDAHTWKITSDRHAPTTIDDSNNTIPNQVGIIITPNAGCNFNDGHNGDHPDYFEFSVFKAGANTGKRNEIGLKYCPVNGDP